MRRERDGGEKEMQRKRQMREEKKRNQDWGGKRVRKGKRPQKQ